MFTTYGLIVLVFFFGTTLFNLFVSFKNYQNRHQPIPENIQDIYEESKYKTWLNYFMENFRFEALKQIINAVLILVLLFASVFHFIFEQVQLWTQVEALQILLFVGIYFFLSFLVETAFAYYQTFHLEEKYGFNKSTKKIFWTDKIKGMILAIVFGGGLIYLISVLYTHMNYLFYLATFLIVSIIMIFMNLFYVKLFVPLFNKITPLEDGELKEAIVSFAMSVGYEIGKIGVIDASKRSTKLNAYFSGFGKMKQIVLYDTLIQKMSSEEIVSVLAHEIGHNKYKHVISGMIGAIVLLAVYIGLLYFTLNIEGFYTVFGFDQIFLGFGLILFLVLLSPLEIILGFALNSISRKHEFQADAYSAKNYKSDSMISALKVLARNNLSNLNPHPLYVKLMYSHPPTTERIKAIEKLGS